MNEWLSSPIQIWDSPLFCIPHSRKTQVQIPVQPWSFLSDLRPVFQPHLPLRGVGMVYVVPFVLTSFSEVEKCGRYSSEPRLCKPLWELFLLLLKSGLQIFLTRASLSIYRVPFTHHSLRTSSYKSEIVRKGGPTRKDGWSFSTSLSAN